MKPKDAIEGVLMVTQMTPLHNQMMHYMRQSLEKEWEAEMCIARFTKLNRHLHSQPSCTPQISQSSAAESHRRKCDPFGRGEGYHWPSGIEVRLNEKIEGKPHGYYTKMPGPCSVRQSMRELCR